METVSTLMLVDDNDATRHTMKMMLGRSGKRIIETADGATALDLFKANAIDLLITDIERTGMDGVALIRAVREINPDMKVIVASGYDEGVVRCLLDGDSSIHFLKKPFDRREFVALVDKVLAT